MNAHEEYVLINIRCLKNNIRLEIKNYLILSKKGALREIQKILSHLFIV
jgi:hypothetical protein